MRVLPKEIWDDSGVPTDNRVQLESQRKNNTGIKRERFEWFIKEKNNG